MRGIQPCALTRSSETLRISTRIRGTCRSDEDTNAPIVLISPSNRRTASFSSASRDIFTISSHCAAKRETFVNTSSPAFSRKRFSTSPRMTGIGINQDRSSQFRSKILPTRMSGDLGFPGLSSSSVVSSGTPSASSTRIERRLRKSWSARESCRAPRRKGRENSSACRPYFPRSRRPTPWRPSRHTVPWRSGDYGSMPETPE